VNSSEEDYAHSVEQDRRIKLQLAFVMTMGPGESEMAIDNLEAIASYYPNAYSWVRDDATTDGTWEAVQEWSKEQKVHLSRNPYAYGYTGTSRSYGQLLLELAPLQPKMVIKIDPDTVLVSAGLEKHFEERFAAYGNGICGSYLYSPNGHRRSFTRHGLRVLLDVLPVGPKKAQRSLRWGTVGYLPFILSAMRHGYRLGENVQGGLYAIEGSILNRLYLSGFLNAMAHGKLGMVREEDVLLTLGVKAVGGNIVSVNESLTNGPTHIQATRPLSIRPERLTCPDLMAVHPVKSVDSEIRKLLRESRSVRVGGVEIDEVDGHNG
jgi:hypothetical protein